MMLVYSAMVQRNTADAREILVRMADLLAAGKAIPPILTRYLAMALHSIGEGEDAAQALSLRANARQHLSVRQLHDVYFAVEWHKLRGAKNEKEAVHRAAKQLGLKPPAAAKRYQKAKPVFAGVRRIIEELRAERIGAPVSLGRALAGETPGDEFDLWHYQLITLLGAPKKGRYPIFPKVLPGR
jgi:hypothetical protein